MSEEAKEFISSLLIADPTQRPTAAEALKHPWILKFYKQRKNARMLSKNVIKNLKKFNSERRLEMAVISYIANYLTQAQNNQILRETFELMDKDHDGVLSKQELVNGMIKIHGNKAFLNDQIDEMLENIDLNGNGVIDYSEFVTATADYQKLCTEKNLKQAFEKFDLDGNGQISFEELQEVLGGEEDDDDIKALIKAVDKNGDGQINFEEFKDMMITLYRRNSMIPEFAPKPGSLTKGFSVDPFADIRRISMYK